MKGVSPRRQRGVAPPEYLKRVNSENKDLDVLRQPSQGVKRESGVGPVVVCRDTTETIQERR